MAGIFGSLFPNSSVYFLPNSLATDLFFAKPTRFVEPFHAHLPTVAAPGMAGIIPPMAALTATEFQLIQSNGLFDK